MKRIAIVTCALAMAAGTANAQGLTMQMSNGWNFSFSGNVNAFLVYTDGKCSSTVLNGAGGTGGCGFGGGLVSTGEGSKASAIRTGLLPAFATFEAKGKEGGVDLGVHFGFAPQIQNANGVHDNFGNGTQAGAQIDMRQVYLTAGGTWGQILAGREIGLYQRGNILNDMTLFGVGPAGGTGFGNGGGTTLGRIGYGYVYPNFVAQMTYSSPATNPAQISIGLFDPSAIGGSNGYTQTKIPRVESEVTYTSHFGATTAEAPKGADKFMVFASGEWQHASTPSTSSVSKNSYGGAGGVRADFGGLSLVGSGFYGKGIGTVLMFDSGNEVDSNGDLRTSYGFIGQAEFQPMGTQWKFGASYGENDLKQTSTDNSDCDGNCFFVKKNSAIVGSVTYLWTKSLRWVAEYTYSKAKAQTGEKATANQGAVGMMLFF
ncbi:MAG: hypothetical protein ABI884_08565 [Gemmatimonadota bacterium]